MYAQGSIAWRSRFDHEVETAAADGDFDV